MPDEINTGGKFARLQDAIQPDNENEVQDAMANLGGIRNDWQEIPDGVVERIPTVLRKSRDALREHNYRPTGCLAIPYAEWVLNRKRAIVLTIPDKVAKVASKQPFVKGDPQAVCANRLYHSVYGKTPPTGLRTWRI